MKTPRNDNPKPPETLELTARMDITAAADAGDGDGKPALPRFSMVAYTGGAMKVGGWRAPVVIDLAGLAIPRQNMPIRESHDARIGHAESIRVEEGKLVAAGLISCTGQAAREVVADAKNGFPWQASIGAGVDQYEFVKEGQSVLVNGSEFKGPMYVVRRATLGEISFVDLGADGNTSAKVAAKAKEHPMDDVTADTQTQTLPPAQVEAAKPTPGRDVDAIIAAARKERERCQKITALIEAAASTPGADLDALDELSAKALEEKWTVNDLDLAVLRLTRPKAPPVGHVRERSRPTQPVLEAALCMACGVSGEKLAKDRDYGEQTVEAAWKHRNMGFHGLFATALAADGITAPHGGRDLYMAAVEHARTIRAGYSTVSLPGILGNVANKVLLDSFLAVNATYERIAQQAEFNNFHTHTIYRLDHTGEFALVPPTGEIKHGKLGETSYTNKLDTRGQMLVLPRQAVISDDLSALPQLTGLLGRKARIAVEKALYQNVMEASDVFYTSARGNKLTSNPLNVESLAAAEAAMLSMVDADGEPIYAAPAILLVPPGLKYLADMLYTSAVVSADATGSGTAKQKPTDNPFRGRFRVESSPYMSLSSMAGYSATGWYLLADPNMLPAFQVAYLTGRRSPTIESSDAEFNTLGVQFRAYFDFGVAQLDYRGAVSSDA